MPMLHCFALQDLHALHSTVSDSLAHAGAWFLHSGIQEPNGGVARYHLSAEGRNLPVSTEITGYACSTYSYLYRLTAEEAYRAAGVRAAAFLADVAWQPAIAAMPFEVGDPLPPAYFFDCGIIVRGLLTVYRMTGEARWLDRARDIGLFMGRAFRANGTCHPILALPSMEPWPYEKRWSREPGCLQLKSAMAWEGLAAHFPGDPFLDWYEEALAAALGSWETFLPGDPDPLKVMDRLHAHCYFLEGMQPRRERPEVRATLAAAIDRTSHYLREISPRFERSDVCAQLLRARLYTGDVNRELAADEAARCRTHQMFGAAPMENGGFCFGRRDGHPMPYMNPVSTAFCLQALEQWREFEAGEFTGDLAELI
jgi:hypothetical protein